MALNPEQLEEILRYATFASYDAEQKSALRVKLESTRLQNTQLAVLFSDGACGSVIHDLVGDSHSDATAAGLLGKIIANTRESISPEDGYAPTPIIQNMIGRLGPYDDAIANEVISLVKDHIEICGARVIEPTAQNQHSPEESAMFTAILNRLNIQPNRLTSQQRANLLYGVRLFEHAYPRELERVNNILTNDPDNIAARLERATLQLYAAPVESLNDYNYVLERHPDNVDALLGRGALYEKIGHEEARALADYRHILDIYPDNQTARDGVARLSPNAPTPSP